MIHDGDLKIDGTPLEVAQAYQELNSQRLDLANLESQFSGGDTEASISEQEEEARQRKENVDFRISHEITDSELIFNLDILPKRSLEDAVLTFCY